MPCEKRIYQNRAEAEAACANAKAGYRKSGKGKQSYQRLTAYKCHTCPYWHIGRARKLPKNYKPPVPDTKPPSFGDLRRKLERLEREWTRKEDYQRRQRAEALGRVIAAEQELLKADDKYRQLVRDVEAMFLGPLTHG